MSSRLSKASGCATLRKASFETLESRLVFSVDAFAPVFTGELIGPNAPQTVPWSLTDAHAATGARYVMDDYGLDGSGQTVAIIDSGIAWDHYALGGGLGAGHRVVGGWDFAENDSNPYDDGPAGFHGTHVAGIVGSSDANNPGVASGADLVALRVFDDQGRGSLEWVELALRWVHEHRFDFENPITAVNLSLGADWNSGQVPGWASLEDELSQLRLDGMFISVAAGNAFRNYQTPGLAYPAASEHVVPVASHDGDGQLSDFSQRHDRVLVAPGRSIRSTVPDHLFGGTQSGAWLGASGTSMAAPYVAGASTLVRQAMEFMGDTNIGQQSIYEHLRATADRFLDSATGNSFHRINLGRAIDAIIDDLHGNIDSPHQAGQLNESLRLSGTIGKRIDVDAFAFTAAESGRVTLELTQTHELSSIVRINNQSLQFYNHRATFDVVAGEQYVLSISTGDGRGHYTIRLDAEALPTGGSQLRDGVLHIRGTAGNDRIALAESADGQWLSATVNGQSRHYHSASVTRILVDGQAGQDRLFLKSGAGNHVVVAAAGQVSMHGSGTSLVARSVEQVQLAGDHADRVVLNGGAGNDAFRFADGSAHLSSNGLSATATGFGTVLANLDGGNDSVRLEGSDGHDSVHLNGERIRLQTSQTVVAVRGSDYVFVDGEAGSDRLTMEAMASDRVRLQGTSAELTAGGVRIQVARFENLVAVATENGVQGQIAGTIADEVVFAAPDRAVLSGPGYRNVLAGFDVVSIDAGAGLDRGWIADSIGSDQVVANHYQTRITGAGFDNRLTGFDSVVVDATAGGIDRVSFTGTRGRDVMHYAGSELLVTGARYQFVARGFHTIDVGGGGGFDSAAMFGGSGNDMLTFGNRTATMRGGSQVTARDFERVRMDGGNGVNSIELTGLRTGDRLTAADAGFQAWLADSQLEASGFSWLEASVREGESAEREIGAVDFWYALHGQWSDAGSG